MSSTQQQQQPASSSTVNTVNTTNTVNTVNTVNTAIQASKSCQGSSTAEDRMVYTLPRRTHGHIVDIMLKIMDPEGPRPMRNMRPAQKTHNCADRFYVEHHAGYEALAQTSRDKIQDVNTHNTAYPKLYDELNKRNSIIKITPLHMSRNAQPSCEHHSRRSCLKMRTWAEHDRHSRRSSCSYCARTHNRIHKSKYNRRYRSPRRVYHHDRIKTTNACCSNYTEPGTDSMSTINDIIVSVPSQDVCVAERTRHADPNVASSRMATSLKASKKPSKLDLDSHARSSVPSVSSYNTFLSMDHEPMVEE